jgi:hypothetical protein
MTNVDNEASVTVSTICVLMIAATATYFHRNRLRRTTHRAHRRFWVRPMFANRRKYSEYYTLFEKELQNDDDQFYNYVRMSKKSFNKLFDLLKDGLMKNGRREPISARERLVITLRFLGHGKFLYSMRQLL